MAKNYFYVSDGGIIKSIRNLAEELLAMPDEVYGHHANAEKNDFSSWLQYEFGLDDLAAKIRNKSQAEASNIISSFLAEKPKQEAKPEAKPRAAAKVKVQPVPQAKPEPKPRVKVIEKIIEKPVIKRIIVRPKPIIKRILVKQKPIIKRIYVKQKPKTIIKKVFVKQEPIIKRIFVRQKPKTIIKKVFVKQKPIVKVVEKIVKVPVKPAIDEATVAKLMKEKEMIEADIKHLGEQEVSAKQKARESQNAMELAGKKAVAAKKELDGIAREREHAAKLLTEKLAAIKESTQELARVEEELGKKSGELKQTEKQLRVAEPSKKGIQKKLQEAEAASDRAVYCHRVMKLAEKEASKAQAELAHIKAMRDSASAELNEKLVQIAKGSKALSDMEGKIRLMAEGLREKQIAVERMLRNKEELVKETRFRDELAAKAEKNAAYKANFLRQVEKHVKDATGELDRVIKEHKVVSTELQQKTALVQKLGKDLAQLDSAGKKSAATVEEKKQEMNYLIGKIDHLNRAAKASEERCSTIKAEKAILEKEYGKLAQMANSAKKQADAFSRNVESMQKQIMEKQKRNSQLETEYAKFKKTIPLLAKGLSRGKAELATLDKNGQAARQDIGRLRHEQDSLRESTHTQLKQLESLRGIIKENERIIQERQRGFVEKETSLFSRENELTERELRLRQFESEVHKARAGLDEKARDIETRLKQLEKKEKKENKLQASGQPFPIAQK